MDDLKLIYSLLNQVLPNKVNYAFNNDESIIPPFIIYQEISKRNQVFIDDSIFRYEKTIQITLVTYGKNIELEESLEKTLEGSGLFLNLVNEYYDSSYQVFHRVYELRI